MMYTPQKIKRTKTTQGGFSLIELMVSLTVFSITMLISVGTLLILIDLNAKAQAMYSSTTNLSFMLDSMTREIRMGYHYYCYDAGGDTQTVTGVNDTRDCAVNDSTNRGFIAFTRESDNSRIAYRFAAVTGGKGAVEQRIVKGAADTGWVQITSSDIDIKTFVFTVENSKPYANGFNNSLGGKAQPVVTVMIKGEVNNGLENATDFNIQTQMTGRRLDLI